MTAPDAEIPVGEAQPLRPDPGSPGLLAHLGAKLMAALPRKAAEEHRAFEQMRAEAATVRQPQNVGEAVEVMLKAETARTARELARFRLVDATPVDLERAVARMRGAEATITDATRARDAARDAACEAETNVVGQQMEVNRLRREYDAALVTEADEIRAGMAPTVKPDEIETELKRARRHHEILTSVLHDKRAALSDATAAVDIATSARDTAMAHALTVRFHLVARQAIDTFRAALAPMLAAMPPRQAEDLRERVLCELGEELVPLDAIRAIRSQYNHR